MKTLLKRLDLSYLYAFLGELTLGLTFIFYIVLARVLGPDEYGIFAAAVALGGVLSLLIQFGLPTLLGREVAANPQKGAQSTTLCLLIEILNTGIICLFLFPVTRVLGFEGHGILICFLVLITEVCRSAKITLRNVLRGIGEFSTETISVSIERLLTYGFAGAALFWTESLIWVVTTIIFVRCLDLIGLIYYVSRKTQILSTISVSGLWKSLLAAYPFAISGVLWVLYYQVDILTLQWLTHSTETGYYSAAYRTIEIFSALPRVVFYVTFTRFASCYSTQPDSLPREIYKSVRLLLAGVLPVIIVAGFLINPMVEGLYGKSFVPAVDALAILIPSLGIKLFGSLSQYFLEATGREKALPPVLLTTVIINIVANVILIPHLGAVGAAIATLLSEVILATVGLNLIGRTGYKRIGENLQKIALLSLLAASVPSLIRIGLHPGLGSLLILSSLVAIAILMNPKIVLKEPY